MVRNISFADTQCLNEFREPEKELKKLRIQVAVSIVLTIPIIFLSLPHMLPSAIWLFTSYGFDA